MKKHLKPILALLLLTTILTELLTTNFTLFTLIAQPWILLLLLTMGYGFPILVIREIIIRKNLGLLGIFFLGIIYGLYNEGLVARTIFNHFHAPIDTFAVYGLVENIRIPWTLTITFWHALHALIYPLAFVHYLYPTHSQESWIGKKTAWFLAILVLAFGSVVFFLPSSEKISGQLNHYIFMILSCLVLWFISKKMYAPKISYTETPFSWRKIGFGILLYLIITFVPILFAGLKLPLVLFIIYFGLMTFWGIRKLSKTPEIALFNIVMIGIGSAFANSIFVFVGAVATLSLDRFISSSLFLIILLVISLRLKKKSIIQPVNEPVINPNLLQ